MQYLLTFSLHSSPCWGNRFPTKDGPFSPHINEKLKLLIRLDDVTPHKHTHTHMYTHTRPHEHRVYKCSRSSSKNLRFWDRLSPVRLKLCSPTQRLWMCWQRVPPQWVELYSGLQTNLVNVCQLFVCYPAQWNESMQVSEMCWYYKCWTAKASDWVRLCIL